MTRHRFEPANLGLALLALMSIVSFDLFTKLVIIDLVMQPPRPIPLTSFLSIELGFNTGIPFGLFSEFFAEFPKILIAGSTVTVAFLLVWAAATKSRLQSSALGLIAGGAIAKTWDRVQRGAVTEFIDIHVREWHWPALNLADIAIVLGAAGLVIAFLRRNSNQSGRIE